MVTADAWANTFIDSSFRDAADEDYIAARASYGLDLTHAFLWNSLQTVEKYIKAILLYNRRPTRDLGHDVKTGLTRQGHTLAVPERYPAVC